MSIAEVRPETASAAISPGRRRWELLLQLGPGTLWLILFFVIPVVLVMAYSFYELQISE